MYINQIGFIYKYKQHFRLDDESKKISSKGWHSDSEVGGWTSTDSALDNSAASECKKAPIIALATGEDSEKLNSPVTSDVNYTEMDVKRKKEIQLLKLTKRNNFDASTTSKSNEKSIDSGVDTDTCGGSVEIQVSCDVPDESNANSNSKIDSKSNNDINAGNIAPSIKETTNSRPFPAGKVTVVNLLYYSTIISGFALVLC